MGSETIGFVATVLIFGVNIIWFLLVLEVGVSGIAKKVTEVTSSLVLTLLLYNLFSRVNLSLIQPLLSCKPFSYITSSLV